MSEGRKEAANSSDSVNLLAPAKLNLRLRVVGPRGDGYHEIETMMLRLRLVDEITLTAGEPGLRLGLEAPADVPGDESNLCCRAVRVLCGALDREPAVTIRLRKRIPAAAGLGGGSSDAAAVLAGLNRLYGAPLATDDLVSLSAEIGSDVPFFTAGPSCAVVRGRGEHVEPLAAPTSRPALIVVPDFGVSAADAYRWWDEDVGAATVSNAVPTSLNASGAPPDAPDTPEPSTDRESLDWGSLERSAVNDLGPPVERRHPELGAMRHELEALGAGVALLCGSGSSVAGIFRSVTARDAAHERLASESEMPPGWTLVATRTEGPAPD